MRVILSLMIFSFISNHAMDNQYLSLKVSDGYADIPKKYVPEMRVLGLCRNDSPYFSSCKKEEIKMLVEAFDAAKNGKIRSFLQPLSEEYVRSFKDQNIGEGKLRTLLNIAEKLQATDISALCMLHTLPSEINTKISGYFNASSEHASVCNLIERYIVQKSCKSVNPIVEYYIDYCKPLSAISSCGSKKVEFSLSGSVMVYDPIARTIFNELVIGTYPEIKSVTDLSFSGDSKFLSVCVKNEYKGLKGVLDGPSYRVEVWDLSSSQKVYIEKTDTDNNSCIAGLNHDGTLLAIAEYAEGQSESEVKLCRVENGQPILNLSCPCLPRKIMIQQDDKRLLCCAKDITCEFQLDAGKNTLNALNFAHWIFLLKVYNRGLCNPGSVKNNIIYGLLPPVIQEWVLELSKPKKRKKSQEPCSIS